MVLLDISQIVILDELIERTIRKANDVSNFDAVNKEENKILFKNLPSTFQKKANFGNDILANQSSNAKKLLKLENTGGGKFGDGILFDNSGVHRGAIFEGEGEG